MDHSRRGFLSLVGAYGAGAAAALLGVDVERALWIPGARHISIPAPPAPFLRVGDVVTFGTGRYIVTRGCRAVGDVLQARFVPEAIPKPDRALPLEWVWRYDRRVPLGEWKIGDTVLPRAPTVCFMQLPGERAWGTLTPELLRRL